MFCFARNLHVYNCSFLIHSVMPQQMIFPMGEHYPHSVATSGVVLPHTQQLCHANMTEVDVVSREDLEKLSDEDRNQTTLNSLIQRLHVSQGLQKGPENNMASLASSNVMLNGLSVPHNHMNGPSRRTKLNYAMDNVHVVTSKQLPSNTIVSSNKSSMIPEIQNSCLSPSSSFVVLEDINSEEFDDSDRDSDRDTMYDIPTDRNNPVVRNYTSCVEGGNNSDDECCITPPAQRPHPTDFDEIPIAGEWEFT